jgi:hypothetical protein
MSGDHDVCSKCGAGIFACNCDAPTNEPDYVTHNVACCISPEEVARRIQEAKIEGAKDYAEEVYVRARRIAGKKNTDYREFGAAFLELEYERVRGEWPPKE